MAAVYAPDPAAVCACQQDCIGTQSNVLLTESLWLFGASVMDGSSCDEAPQCKTEATVLPVLPSRVSAMLVLGRCSAEVPTGQSAAGVCLFPGSHRQGQRSFGFVMEKIKRRLQVKGSESLWKGPLRSPGSLSVLCAHGCRRWRGHRDCCARWARFCPLGPRLGFLVVTVNGLCSL